MDENEYKNRSVRKREELFFLENETDESVFQHTLFWRELTENMLRDESYYLVVKEDERIIAIVPTFIRRNKVGNVLNSLPLSGSHGGICLRRGLDDEEKELLFRKIFSFLCDFMQSKRCITSTIIMPPFADSTRELYLKYWQPDFVYDRFTQVIDLKAELGYNFKVRNHIRKAIKGGVKICEEISQERVIDFWKIYKGNMVCLNLGVRRLNAK